MEKKFKCKDEVIFRSKYGDIYWTYGIFSHYEIKNDITYAVLLNSPGFDITKWDILPYNGNEYLVGTNNSPDDEIELEDGEYLYVVDTIADNPTWWHLIEYNNTGYTQFFDQGNTSWLYAVRFKNFDPYNMEETKKNILCVKNRRVVRYRR